MGENYFQAKRSIDDFVLGHRIRHDNGDLRALIASIRMIGFVQPITITPSGAVLSGGRRLEAARALGYTSVDVWVRTDVTTELDMLLAEQQENQNRKPYTQIEQARFFDQLRRIFAEDAALRQQATRFGAPAGPPESGTPHPSPDPDLPGSGLSASKRAALVVTGKRSDYTLGHIIELLQLHDDPTISIPLREIVADALAQIDPHGPVEPAYLRVKTAQDTEQLHLIAADPGLPPVVRHVARGELAGLPTEGTPSKVRQDAKQALQRATAAKSNPPAPATAVEVRKPPATIRTYSARALTEMVTDLDYWWLHYDAKEIAASLSEEQWEQLTDWVRNAVRFLDDVTAHRQHPAA